eukprot:gene4505-2316_t
MSIWRFENEIIRVTYEEGNNPGTHTEYWHSAITGEPIACPMSCDWGEGFDIDEGYESTGYFKKNENYGKTRNPRPQHRKSSVYKDDASLCPEGHIRAKSTGSSLRRRVSTMQTKPIIPENTKSEKMQQQQQLTSRL